VNGPSARSAAAHAGQLDTFRCLPIPAFLITSPRATDREGIRPQASPPVDATYRPTYRSPHVAAVAVHLPLVCTTAGF